MTHDLPCMFHVRQTFERPRVEDIAATVEATLAALDLRRTVRPGQSVAVTAGSRGIANIRAILAATVAHLQAIGAKPFVVPAMGSHGGGTVEGQLGILAGYGITESGVGCPIRASMETVVVGHTPAGMPVHFDRIASEADHVLVAGRVKPHTSFTGDVESGLMKMLLIGLGKHEGAKVYHRGTPDHLFSELVDNAAPIVLEKCQIVAGLAILENGYDETALIEAVAPANLRARERELLIQARQWMPRLPFEEIDVLVIDEIGKNISGTGMDTNVVGRKWRHADPTRREVPHVRQIAVRALTAATHGNATGIGLADLCTWRVVRDADLEITTINTATSGHPHMAVVPPHYDSDLAMLRAALATVDRPEPRVVWIRNTLDLAEAACSVACLEEARSRSDLAITGQPAPWPLDEAGNLPPFVA